MKLKEGRQGEGDRKEIGNVFAVVSAKTPRTTRI